MRSDARRNRDRLTEVAIAAFRDEGLDVAVDEIARRSGVGVATLYRHFPAKSDLILAVVHTVLDDLEAAADAALAAPPADATLERFFRAALGQHCRNRGFLAALAEQDLPPEARTALIARATAILEPIVAAGHRTGTLRPDLDATDLLVFVRMLGVVAAARSGRSPDRYLEPLLDGLAGR